MWYFGLLLMALFRCLCYMLPSRDWWFWTSVKQSCTFFISAAEVISRHIIIRNYSESFVFICSSLLFLTIIRWDWKCPDHCLQTIFAVAFKCKISSFVFSVLLSKFSQKKEVAYFCKRVFKVATCISGRDGLWSFSWLKGPFLYANFFLWRNRKVKWFLDRCYRFNSNRKWRNCEIIPIKVLATNPLLSFVKLKMNCIEAYAIGWCIYTLKTVRFHIL